MTNDIGKIIVRDYEIRACHGVNPEEKTAPQRFLFSAEITLDVSAAVRDDDIDQTISYAAVCKRIKAFFRENTFNLLETLAARSAELILKSYPRALAADVEVKKPEAPMKGIFDYVAAAVRRERHTAYLSLGSNEGDRDAYLDKAVALFADDEATLELAESSRIKTPPYGGVADAEFLNSAVKLVTLRSPRGLLELAQSIEAQCGRKRTVRWGNRTLDADIILYDDAVVSEPDLIIPHPDAAARAFVLAPLAELAPAALHPLTKKRVAEMLNDISLISK